MTCVKWFDRIGDVEAALWDKAAGDDYLLSHGYLSHVEATMNEGFDYKYVCVFQDEELAAAAALFSMRLKLDTLLEKGRLKSAIEGARRIWDKAFTMDTLIIGSPPSAGNFGIGLRPGCRDEEAVEALTEAITKKAREEGRKLVMYKEVPESFYGKYGSILEAGGYAFGFDMPGNVFEIKWEDDEQYLSALRGKSRQAIRKSHRKLRQEGIQVEVVRDLRGTFGSEEYAMYRKVLARSDNILETLTPEYFSHMEDLKNMDPCLVSILKDRRIIGYFLVCDAGKDAVTALFAGIDYQWNSSYDTYFNLFHQVLLYSMERKKRLIYFGQNTYEVKQRMGCKRQELYIGFRYRGRLLNRILKRFSRLLMPEIVIEERRVFK